MKTLVIMGHPSMDSFCRALADRYCAGVEDSGDDVERIDITELNFDLILQHGYAQEQTVEPDIADAQNKIQWADHLVFVYPTWWAAPPALLKSFIERTLLPGFAFQYKQSKWVVSWDKHLTNRSARVISTMDSPPLYYRWVKGDPGYRMMKDILTFCGVTPVARTYFGSVKTSTEAKRQTWLERSYRLGWED